MRYFLFVLLSVLSVDSYAIVNLGNHESETTYIYLCGLTDGFDSVSEKTNHKILDQIGKELEIKIIAVPPPKRNPIYHDMFCWPHHDKNEVLETYAYIQQKIQKTPICGYIGFSNGGFFLLKLAEQQTIEVPIIVIGAGIYATNTELKNKIFLLIGDQDISHHALAKRYHEQTQNTQLDVTLIEYEGNHTIPEIPLKELMRTSTQRHSCSTH
ncbi:MAG: hypothetical protein EBU93_01750 [Chlamydiae bacterium]|nr:hypothetical protein [Chlamydiota bacterium]